MNLVFNCLMLKHLRMSGIGSNGVWLAQQYRLSTGLSLAISAKTV
jgi:hypothetical protein